MNACDYCMEIELCYEFISGSIPNEATYHFMFSTYCDQSICSPRPPFQSWHVAIFPRGLGDGDAPIDLPMQIDEMTCRFIHENTCDNNDTIIIAR